MSADPSLPPQRRRDTEHRLTQVTTEQFGEAAAAAAP